MKIFLSTELSKRLARGFSGEGVPVAVPVAEFRPFSPVPAGIPEEIALSTPIVRNGLVATRRVFWKTNFFLVGTSTGENFSAKKVLLAIGRRGTPRKLGVPGEELEKVAYRLLEPEIIVLSKIFETIFDGKKVGGFIMPNFSKFQSPYFFTLIITGSKGKNNV